MDAEKAVNLSKESESHATLLKAQTLFVCANFERISFVWQRQQRTQGRMQASERHQRLAGLKKEVDQCLPSAHRPGEQLDPKREGHLRERA